MDEKKNIVITYETLFEVLRKEKSREEIQKLEASFADDVRSYFFERRALLAKQNPEDTFGASEKEKIERQISNAKKILRELYDRREKKIVLMAINKSRAKGTLVDSSALLPNEKSFFEEITALLDRQREAGLLPLISEKFDSAEAKELKRDGVANNTSDLKESPSEAASSDKSLLIKFVEPVPKFVGPNLEIYGPYNPEDTASLPEEIASILINKNCAEQV